VGGSVGGSVGVPEWAPGYALGADTHACSCIYNTYSTSVAREQACFASPEHVHGLLQLLCPQAIVRELQGKALSAVRNNSTRLRTAEMQVKRLQAQQQDMMLEILHLQSELNAHQASLHNSHAILDQFPKP